MSKFNLFSKNKKSNLQNQKEQEQDIVIENDSRKTQKFDHLQQKCTKNNKNDLYQMEKRERKRKKIEKENLKIQDQKQKKQIKRQKELSKMRETYYYQRLKKLRKHFSHPFILIDDVYYLYRSSSKEFSKARVPSSRRFYRRRSRGKNKFFSIELLKKKQQTKKIFKKKPVKGSGNCRICGMKYKDLDEHINTKKHRNFAKLDDNYLEIDLLFQQIVKENEMKSKTNMQFQLSDSSSRSDSDSESVSELESESD
ncbi:protein dbf4 [Anaeramoeba flamelloides]|uniref:Protein dbf4 n=1 Tax=Anaeramoeba flamelloides TaxID=1746091 RepID=A0ABQ8YGR4_9EUKA|nr:protein dbf4 [Anaeramoeba flamelloides]